MRAPVMQLRVAASAADAAVAAASVAALPGVEVLRGGVGAAQARLEALPLLREPRRRLQRARRAIGCPSLGNTPKPKHSIPKTRKA